MQPGSVRLQYAPRLLGAERFCRIRQMLAANIRHQTPHAWKHRQPWQRTTNQSLRHFFPPVELLHPSTPRHDRGEQQDQHDPRTVPPWITAVTCRSFLAEITGT